MMQKSLIALCLVCVAHPALAAGRGYFGASFGNLPATENAQTGVVVKRVFAGMAAQRAGIKLGEIVTKINGVSVHDAETAVGLLAENSAGEKVRLTVIDEIGGKLRQSNVVVTLGGRPTEEFSEIMTVKPVPPPHPCKGPRAGELCSNPLLYKN